MRPNLFKIRDIHFETDFLDPPLFDGLGSLSRTNVCNFQLCISDIQPTLNDIIQVVILIQDGQTPQRNCADGGVVPRFQTGPFIIQPVVKRELSNHPRPKGRTYNPGVICVYYIEDKSKSRGEYKLYGRTGGLTRD